MLARVKMTLMVSFVMLFVIATLIVTTTNGAWAQDRSMGTGQTLTCTLNSELPVLVRVKNSDNHTSRAVTRLLVGGQIVEAQEFSIPGAAEGEAFKKTIPAGADMLQFHVLKGKFKVRVYQGGNAPPCSL